MRTGTRVRAVCSIGATAAVLATTVPAFADSFYRVAGSDSFALGSSEQGVIGYAGTETLKAERSGKNTRFTARVKYVRTDQGARSIATGSFVEELLPDGETRDAADNDPDFLTILNQPFAVQLDGGALHALSHLHQTIPFDFPAPIVGASLHGSLAHSQDGSIAGHRVVALSFRASGPMRGQLPTSPLSLVGTIHLDGRAYYDGASALLLALEMTLEIDGRVTDNVTPQAVKIIYRRALRMDPGAIKEAGP